MPNPPFKLEIHRILKHYFEDLETVLKQQGLGGRYEALVGELGLCWEDFGEQPGRLEFHHYLSALRLLDAERQIPGLGLKAGALKHCSPFGFAGLAYPGVKFLLTACNAPFPDDSQCLRELRAAGQGIPGKRRELQLSDQRTGQGLRQMSPDGLSCCRGMQGDNGTEMTRAIERARLAGHDYAWLWMFTRGLPDFG